MAHVKEHFCELPPEALVQFEAPHGLRTGAELFIVITPAQPCCVRVVHQDAQSITLGTLEGHPQPAASPLAPTATTTARCCFTSAAGRGRRSAVKLLGVLTVGEAMQTNTWTDFINRTAVSVGARIRDVIHAQTESFEEEEEDASVESPTFLATGN